MHQFDLFLDASVYDIFRSLNPHQRINIRCHQSLHIYKLYPNLLRDDISDGCHRFEDQCRYGTDIISKVSITHFKKPYTTVII